VKLTGGKLPRALAQETQKMDRGSGSGHASESFGGVDGVGGTGYHGGDPGGRGALGEAAGHHLVNLGRVAREERLHGSVAAVADPPGEPQRARRLHGPVPEEDALHAARHHHAHRLGLLRVGGTGSCSGHGAAGGAGEGEEEAGGGGGREHSGVEPVEDGISGGSRPLCSSRTKIFFSKIA
jgi:hypothetical protein